MINHAIEDDSDPFSEADECMELQGLIEQTGGEGCTVDEFLTGDNDLPVCVEMDDGNWDAAFLEEFGEDQQKEVCGHAGDGDSDDEQSLPKLNTYKEAITALEEVSRFLQFKGHVDEALSIGSTIDRIVTLKHKSTRQSTLHDYFTQ